jgi:hypothetical protein
MLIKLEGFIGIPGVTLHICTELVSMKIENNYVQVTKTGH